MKKIVLIMVMCAGVLFANAQLIKRDFLDGYGVGEDLEKGAYSGTDQATVTIKPNQWNLSGKAGANDQGGSTAITTGPLFYADYAESGNDVAIAMAKQASGYQRTTIYSLVSDNTYGAGTYYLAFMTNVMDASPTATHEYVAFDGNFTGNAQRARIAVRRTAEEAPTYGFGLSGDGAAPTSVSGTFNIDETYLLVLKVVLAGGGAGTASLYVNPDPKAAEPASALINAVVVSGLNSIRGVVVRQRSTIEAEIGGFRCAKTWEDALGQGGSAIPAITADKGEIATVNCYTVTGCKVSEPASGICIQKTVYKSGAVETAKILK